MKVLKTIVNLVYECVLCQPVNYLTVGLRLINLVCLILLSYFLAQRAMAFMYVRARKGGRRFRQENRMSVNIKRPYVQYRIPLLRFIDNILENNGRPLGLTAVKYLIVKIALGLVTSIPTLILNMNTVMVLIFGLLGFFSLDLLLVADSIDNNKRIEKDMPNIINNLYMQMEANIPFKQCLETLHMSAVHSKLLKNCLKELQLKFLIKDHDIVAVCDDIENKMKNVSFCVLLMAFRQYKDSGKMKDILRRQNELHMKKEEELIERESRAVIKLAAASTALIAVNCILMLVYPMFLTMNEKMQVLLK